VPSRRVLRIVTAMLLAWVAFDLMAIDTCALDVDGGTAPLKAPVACFSPQGASAHPDAVPHPDHCFCHGLSTAADTSAAVIDPFFAGGAVTDTPPGHLLQAATALYHPPQPIA
jgi:hypothetical protein